MALAEESCVSCRTGEGKLTPAEAETLATELNGWEIAGLLLAKRFDFKNFKLALAFVNAIGAVAEAQKHHPDITFGWGFVEIYLTTHSAEGLTRNDFIVAAKIDGMQAA